MSGYYIGATGYYEGDRKHEDDIPVPQRPTSHHVWGATGWTFNEHSREDWLTKVVRPKRDVLLNEADIKYCNADRWETMTEEQKTAWRLYKQQLRDFPEVADYTNLIWPSMPV